MFTHSPRHTCFHHRLSSRPIVGARRRFCHDVANGWMEEAGKLAGWSGLAGWSDWLDEWKGWLMEGANQEGTKLPQETTQTQYYNLYTLYCVLYTVYDRI